LSTCLFSVPSSQHTYGNHIKVYLHRLQTTLFTISKDLPLPLISSEYSDFFCLIKRSPSAASPVNPSASSNLCPLPFPHISSSHITHLHRRPIFSHLSSFRLSMSLTFPLLSPFHFSHLPTSVTASYLPTLLSITHTGTQHALESCLKWVLLFILLTNIVPLKDSSI